MADSITTNNVYIDLAYEDTDFTRTYKLQNVSYGSLSSVAQKVINYNANVPANDKKIFVSDDGDHMTSIAGAKAEIITTSYIIKR